MMRFLFIILLTTSLFSTLGCGQLVIPLFKTEISIDGIESEPVWKKINGYSQFESPWDTLPDQGTVFKSFHNGEYIYFYFSVIDSKVNCYDHKLNDRAVEYSDRVELFFALDSMMTQYCGLEFDACNRKQQFFADGYRHFTKNWEFPSLENSDFAAKLTTSGYQIEGRLSMKALSDLGMLKDGYINLGVFRADRQSEDAHAAIRWISWKDIKTEKPDFHTKEGFRKVRLEKSYSGAKTKAQSK